MHDLRAFLAAIESDASPPAWPPGALRATWDACDDVETMIAVLRRGGAMGVFEVDSTRGSECRDDLQCTDGACASC